jgi:hypothetical protein
MGLLLVTSLLSGVGSAALSGGGAPADASAAPESTQFVLEGDELPLEAGSGQVVHGETDLPAGTTLSVRVTKTSGSPRFIYTDEAVVAPDGTFRATFDMADAPVGATADVSVHHGDTELASTTARTVECTEACAAPDPQTPTASLEFGGNATLEAAPGRTVAGETNLRPGADIQVRLNRTDGGAPDFLFVRSATVGADGRFRVPFNLTGVPAGAEFRTSVRHDGAEVTNATGTVTDCQTRCETPPASASRSAETADRNYTQFDDLNSVRTTQGEVARIELTFESENATLTVGGPTVSYALNLSVRDGDDDDRVVVLFETDRVGHGDDAVSAADPADSVSVIDERVDGDRDVLDEGEYPLTRSNGPLSTTPNENASTFVVETGVLLVRDAPLDEDGNESVVEEPGLPQEWVDGEYEGPEPIRVRMNETTRIPIRTDESKAVTAVVGAYDSPYTLSAVVEDGNGDERVVLVLDTTAAREGDRRPAVTTAADADSVAITYENGSIAPATYGVNLYRRAGMPASTDWNTSYSHAGDVFGHGQLIVSESNATPTMASSTAGPASGLPATSLGVLAVGGVVASAGVALLAGVVEL